MATSQPAPPALPVAPAVASDEELPDADAMDEKEYGEAGEAGEAEAQENGVDVPNSDDKQDTEPPPPPPPGPRAARLQALFASSLAHTLSRVSWDNFAACYPTAAANSPTALRTVHSAMVARLGELCANEFEKVMRSRQVVQRLNELEDLMGSAQRRRREAEGSRTQTQKPRPPHTLPPTAILAAHLAPQRRAQKADLVARLQASQVANAARFARLTAQQTEADQLIAALERALADAEGAAALLEDELLAELARETRTVETEMTT